MLFFQTFKSAKVQINVMGHEHIFGDIIEQWLGTFGLQWNIEVRLLVFYTQITITQINYKTNLRWE